jgi:TRAP-type uncharacterized transport system fused permease subunit
VLVVIASMAAMLIFAAITMVWFRIRMRLWEAVVLAIACVLLFRPDMFMGMARAGVHAPAAREGLRRRARPAAERARRPRDQGPDHRRATT